MSARGEFVFVALVLLGTAAAAAQQTAAEAPAEEARGWEFDASVYGFFPPEDRHYAQPTATADRGALHLEARYNYEAFKTGSVWVGWNFAVGEKLRLEVTIMAGGVFGDTRGAAPGYELTLSYGRFELYGESEHVFDTDDSGNNFFYNWAQLGCSPVDWLSVGFASQRTRTYQTGLDVQRGFFVGFKCKSLNLAALLGGCVIFPRVQGGRSRMLTRIAHARGLPASLVLSLLLLVAGCSHTVSRGMTFSALHALPPNTALRAYVHHDDILLVFGDGAGRTIFLAHWKENVLEPRGDVRFRIAELTVVEKLPSSVEKLRPSVREATIVPAAQTVVIVKHMVERLAPASTGEAVRLAFFETEYAIFRDAGGEARYAPLAQAPKGLKEVGRLNPTQFAAALFEAVQEDDRERGDSHRLWLIESAREGKPSTFFLLDLDQKLVVVTQAPNQADVASEKMSLHGGARTLEAALIEGQLLAAIKNPVSFAGRAVNFGVETLLVMLRPWHWPKPDFPPVAAEGPGPGMDLPSFESWLDSHMGPRRYKGSIRLFVNGDEFFPLLDRRVDEAKESIHFRVCIWDNDDTGVDMADRVKRRSLDIKETDVVVDRVTSLDASLTPPASPMPAGFQPPRAIQPYLRDGSRVHVRNFLNGMTMGDHAKVYIVDRQYAYIGGMNVGREYRHEWHDVMVELEGPIVGWFERDFQLAWSHAGALGDLAYSATYLTQGKDFVGPETREDYVEIRPIFTKTGNPVVLRSLVEALSRAKRYAWIENPYIYDDSIIRALIKARRRGVDVRVVMPTQSDMNSADSNNKVKANRLLANGVRVYAYPGMLHTKAAVVDGWAMLGSCNFNKLSLRMNDESDIATTDPTFVATLNERLFESDFQSSQILTEPLPVTSSDVFAEALAHQQ